jgi:hypothetical protein
MTQRRQASVSLSPAERRIAAVERAVGTGSLTLGLTLFALGLVQIAAVVLGWTGHPDAMLLPLLASLPFLGVGAVLRVAADAMARGARQRWNVQWGVLALAGALAAVLALSVL